MSSLENRKKTKKKKKKNSRKLTEFGFCIELNDLNLEILKIRWLDDEMRSLAQILFFIIFVVVFCFRFLFY